jgi:hypothetical protein
MRARSIVIGSILAAIVGCTGSSDAPPGEPPGEGPAGDVLTLRTPEGSLIVGPATRSVEPVDGQLSAAPDGSRLYATTLRGTSTVLEVRDSSTGDLLSAARLEGRLDVRVASLTGRSVALMRPLPAGVDPTTALPRRRTTIVVADPAGERTSRRYTLYGNFEPEAFSIDDTRLFLIQYLPAEAPSGYRVTFLDLGSGRVRPVFGRFDSPPERMPGVRLAQVFDPTAEQLYTLYTNDPSAHLHDSWQDASYGDREVSFVHVLNLRRGWAYCAGLPRELWGRPASAQALAPSPDGRSLYVVDSVRGLIAQMDTRTMRITRTQHVSLGGREGGRTTALVSPDGSTLYVGMGGSAVSRIDLETLEVRSRWQLPAAVRGLAVSEDGLRAFFALSDRIAVVDTGTGRTLSTLSVGPIESILHVATS